MSTKLPSRARIITAIQSTAKTLGRTPSRAEFTKLNEMTRGHVYKHFTNWSEAVIAAGMKPRGTHVALSSEELFEDWGNVVRQTRRIPTRHIYREYGKHSIDSFKRRIGEWSDMPAKFRQFAEGQPKWADVVRLLLREETSAPGSSIAKQRTRPLLYHQRNSPLEDRFAYGRPLDSPVLFHEPVNEQGVVYVFGSVARDLRYRVEFIQTGFPDCEAKRELENGRWQRVRIEFEFESRSFRDHGHNPDECDIIVCWIHNWAESPPSLEVVELSSLLPYL